MQLIITTLRSCFKQWFPQRNLIIMSEHKVRHLPISSRAQFAMLFVLAGGVCWAAYSTGSYVAVRLALKEQSQALRTIASARVDANFNALYPAGPLVAAPAEPLDIADADAMQSLTGPIYTFSALDNDKLFARMAFLEQRVAQLQATNSSIIQHVKEKTNGRILDLEGIIRQVGLNPTSLKKELSSKNPPADTSVKKGKSSQGGPYIPADTLGMSPEETLLYHRLDEMDLLQQAVDMLPLSYPIRNSQEQSRFGHRIDPFSGRLAFHAGLDLSGPQGSRIYAPAPGRVKTAARTGSYGNMVDLDHGFSISTRYGHLSKILVKKGQMVKKGDVIGIQGSTGRSTGPHLHYEVRYKDRPVNPKNFLKVASYVSEE